MTNQEQRIARARAALDAYNAASGGYVDDREIVTDLITDLLHLAEHEGEDEIAITIAARGHLHAERCD